MSCRSYSLLIILNYEPLPASSGVHKCILQLVLDCKMAQLGFLMHLVQNHAYYVGIMLDTYFCTPIELKNILP